ncbi:MAG: hypothetical protein AMXMBFR80_19100 [Dehalococcoidia bacterium]
MTRNMRLGLLSMLLTIVLSAGAGLVVQHSASAFGPVEAVVGRFIVRTIALKQAEKDDRREVNDRRDTELSAVDLEIRAVDYSLATHRMSAAEADRQKAQLELKKQAIEERAKRERQVVSFETRRRIDANLRSTFRDAVKFATGVNPRAVDFLAGMIEGKKPLEAALDAALAENPQDPRQPFRDLRDQLKEVERAAQALGGAKGIDVRARVRQALAEATGIADGEGPPPDDKIERLRDLERELARAVGQGRGIFRDFFPGSPGISRDRFEKNDRWRELDAAVAAASGPVAGREALSSIFRRTTEYLEGLVARGEADLTPEEIRELASAVGDRWAQQRRSGQTSLRSSEVDIEAMLTGLLGEGGESPDVAPASPDKEPPAHAPQPPNQPPAPPPASQQPSQANPEPTVAAGKTATVIVPTPTKATAGSPSPSPTETLTATPTAAETTTPTVSPTPTPTPTRTPTPTPPAVTNFAGTWHSAGVCDNPSAPYRWSVGLTQQGAQVSGYINFHQCPGGGRAEYSVSGTATSAGTIQLAATKTGAAGGLGGSAPAQTTFTIAPNGPPNPNLAP